MPRFGKKSTAVRATIRLPLVLLCDSVVKYYDIALLHGRKGKEEQDYNFKNGLSEKPWPTSTHNADPDADYPGNLSKGVDVCPFPVPECFGDLRSNKPAIRDLEWKERVKFYQMMEVFRFEWKRLQDKYEHLKKLKLRCGDDWDGDKDYRDQKFDDLIHIELVEI